MLTETDRTIRRERDLPAPVMVYYVIALALYMQVSYREVLRCLLEGLRWLVGPDATVHAAGPSGISQVRTRLGVAPVQRLYDEVVGRCRISGSPSHTYHASGHAPMTRCGHRFHSDVGA
ncbi:MAG: transposase domain-containing protein [Gemmatimonadaceae bacterium]|nr:transposase domain-containing protein [Gemmatimonadaceae bacterium]